MMEDMPQLPCVINTVTSQVKIHLIQQGLIYRHFRLVKAYEDFLQGIELDVQKMVAIKNVDLLSSSCEFTIVINAVVEPRCKVVPLSYVFYWDHLLQLVHLNRLEISGRNKAFSQHWGEGCEEPIPIGNDIWSRFTWMEMVSRLVDPWLVSIVQKEVNMLQSKGYINDADKVTRQLLYKLIRLKECNPDLWRYQVALHFYFPWGHKTRARLVFMCDHLQDHYGIIDITLYKGRNSLKMFCNNAQQLKEALYGWQLLEEKDKIKRAALAEYFLDEHLFDEPLVSNKPDPMNYHKGKPFADQLRLMGLFTGSDALETERKYLRRLKEAMHTPCDACAVEDNIYNFTIKFTAFRGSHRELLVCVLHKKNVVTKKLSLEELKIFPRGKNKRNISVCPGESMAKILNKLEDGFSLFLVTDELKEAGYIDDDRAVQIELISAAMEELDIIKPEGKYLQLIKVDISKYQKDGTIPLMLHVQLHSSRRHMRLLCLQRIKGGTRVLIFPDKNGKLPHASEARTSLL